MKIAIIGGTGLIGSQTVARLRAVGHEVVAASPASGVNTVTGEGLAEVLAGADAVVDVANSPSFADEAAMDFFRQAGAHLLAAERAAGVGHHVALSVVGTERLQASGYFRAKLVQEQLIAAAPVPYTIVRATQFFEFLRGVADFETSEGIVHLTTAAMQPMASADVAAALTDAVLAEPIDGTVEVAGPERAPLADFVVAWLRHVNDPRKVVVDAEAPYFGIGVNDSSLTPGAGARIMPTRFKDWLAAAVAVPAAAA